MKASAFARILRTFLVAALLLGPALSFAAPMAVAMHHEPGKMVMLAGAMDAAKPGCMDCPMPSNGMAMIASDCDATCPSPVVLPVQPLSPEPQPALTWLILSSPDHPTIASRIEPPPPKSSARI